jgi:hypothetical protein
MAMLRGGVNRGIREVTDLVGVMAVSPPVTRLTGPGASGNSAAGALSHGIFGGGRDVMAKANTYSLAGGMKAL